MKKLIMLFTIGIIMCFSISDNSYAFDIKEGINKTKEVTKEVKEKFYDFAGKPKEAWDNYINDKKEEVIRELKEYIVVEKENIKKEINENLEELNIKLHKDIQENGKDLKKELYKETNLLKEELRIEKDKLENIDKKLSWWNKIYYYLKVVIYWIGILLLLLLFLKVLKKLILFNTIHKINKFSFNRGNESECIKISRSTKSINISVKNNFYIKKNSISKYEKNTKINIGIPFNKEILYLFKSLYFWNMVNNGKFTLRFPNHYFNIVKVVVPKNSIFIFNLANLLAFESGLKIKTKFTYKRLIEGKIAFKYVEGPATLYFYGIGKISKEEITSETSYEKNTVIGYSGNLDRGLSIVDSFWSFIFTNTYIKEKYEGKGIILRQEVGITDSQLKQINKNNSGFFGFIKDIIGLF